MIPHEHDHDLIMSLAEGRLAGDADDARSELERCTECAADLAAQEAALAALGDLRQRNDAELTEFESASLRRHLDRELGHRRISDRTATTKPRRSFSWAPVFSVAAVLLALLLVAPALDLLGGGDAGSGDAFDAAVDEVGAGTDAPAVEQMTVTEDAGSVSEFAPAPPTTVSAAADGAVDEATTQLFAILDAVEVSEGDTTALRSAVSGAFTYSSASPPDACVEEGEAAVDGAVFSSTLGVVVLVPGEPARTITVHQLAGGDYVVVAHDAQTCAEVARAP